MFYALVAANVVMAIILVLNFSSLPPQLPLFFSKPAGDEQLADTWLVLLLPFLMNAFFVFNSFVYKKFFYQNSFAEKIFKVLNVFLLVTFTLIFMRIITLVT